MTTTLLNLNIFSLVDARACIINLFSCTLLMLGNSAVGYTLIYSFILVSLFGNFLRNLVYKVLNLGLMSLLVVTLWAYQTDFNFIYVVYILAFVGAVVMLFLSVVLMLPASAVAAPSALNALLICSSNARPPVSTFSNTVCSFVLFFLLLVTTYIFLLYLFRGERYWRVVPAEPTVPLELICPNNEVAQARAAKWNLTGYAAKHDFYVYAKKEHNALVVQHYSAVTNYSIGKSGMLFIAPAAYEYSPLFVESVPKIEYFEFCDWCWFAKSVVYEFSDYFFRIMEPYVYQASPRHYNYYMQMTIWFRKLIGSRHTGSEFDIRNYFIDDGRRKPLKMLEFHSERTVIIVQRTPWWSPFNIIPKTLDKIRGFHAKYRKKLFRSGFFRNPRKSFRYLIRIFFAGLYTFFYLKRGFALPARLLMAMRRRGNYFNNIWFIHSVEYFIFKHIDSLLFVNKGAYNPRSSVYTLPVWLPSRKFQLPTLVKTAGYPAVFTKVKSEAPPRRLNLLRISLIYEPAAFTLLVRKYCPILIEVSLGKYAIASSRAKVLNKFVFTINFILFFTLNFILNAVVVTANSFKGVSAVTAELLIQSTLAFSIFVLAVPVHAFKLIADADFFIMSPSGIENLGAIQYGLYIENPFFLLVSVNALLVALIGAAVIKGHSGEGIKR